MTDSIDTTTATNVQKLRVRISPHTYLGQVTPEIVTTFFKTLPCVRTVTFFAPAIDIGWHAHATETDEL